MQGIYCIEIGARAPSTIGRKDGERRAENEQRPEGIRPDTAAERGKRVNDNGINLRDPTSCTACQQGCVVDGTHFRAIGQGGKLLLCCLDT